MVAFPNPRLTAEEYLEIERQAEFKSEYFAGQMYAMAGASLSHNQIEINLIGELRNRLKGRPCQAFTDNMKVEAGPGGLFAYPDVTVGCGDPKFHDDYKDVLTNPTVIIEILSPSTSDYDHGTKFTQYKRLDSLLDYIMVSQDSYLIEHYVRLPDNTWHLRDIIGADNTLTVESIGCGIPFSEIYDRVKFENPE